MNQALLSSKNMSWCTPQHFFDRLIDHSADVGKVKTRQERFLKMFPRADAHTGLLEVCPGDIDVRYTCHGSKDCADCKKEYWLTAEKEGKS